ncbi:MAG: diguanylate cyclase [Oligoflexales bacterium]
MKKILVIDTKEDQFFDVLKGLLPECSFVKIFSAEEAWEKLEDLDPHIVIVSESQQDADVYEFCQKMSSRGIEQSYIGVIVAFESFDESSNQDLLDYADDFLVKTRSHIELKARILSSFQMTGMASVLREHHLEMLHTNERLSKVSITDELTGLYNMRYFHKRLRQEFVRAKRYNKDLSVLMFDVDKFKSVNDQNDHLLGSHVLASIGEIVSQTIRSVDIAARFGGDEYVVLLPETSKNGAFIFAERLREKIKKKSFQGTNKEVFVTVSIGVGSLECDKSFTDPQNLMKLADHQLYKAKENGRDNVQVC